MARPSPTSRSSAIVGGLVGAALGLMFDIAFESVALYVALGALAGARVGDLRRVRALEDQIARLRSGDSPILVTPHDTPARVEPDVPATATPARDAPEPKSAPTPAPVRPTGPRRPLVNLPPELAEPLRRAWAFATGGNPIVRVALVVLFVGFGIGIRYAAQAGLFPVELRLIAAGLAGLGLTGLGWALRRSSPAFALAVQGGGIALLYLTVYAAFALVGLLSSPVALAGMAAVALASGVLAVVQDAPGLAFLGALGGFAAPVVASSGTGSHVMLFSYYLALGLGIAGLVWTRGWRSLAVLGVIGTFGVGGWWGGLEYRPELYASTQPFLIAFFALYFALALRLAWLDLRAPSVPERDVAIDSTLVFGLPVATFLLQRGLVEAMPYGDAWSAAALAAVYLGVWAAIRARRAPWILSDALLAVGLAFATLAAPLAFQRVVAGALWSLEAAALVWTGVRQNKLWMRVAGIGLAVGAASVLFVEGVVDPGRAFRPETLTGWLVAVSLFLCAFVLRRAAPQTPDADGVRPGEQLAGRLLLAAGVVWWGLTAATHAVSLTAGDAERTALLGALGASALLFALAGRALRWPGLARAALLLSVIAVGGALTEIVRAGVSDGSPLDTWGAIGWALVAVGLGTGLWVTRGTADRAHVAAFAVGAWSLVGVAALSLAQGVPEAWGEGWLALASMLPPAAMLASLTVAGRSGEGILDRFASPAGRLWAGGGLALAVGLGVAVVSTWPGDAAPLPTVPVLNPADLAAVGGLAALAGWLRAATGRSAWMGWAVGLLTLIAITGTVGRGTAALGAVPFDWDALFEASGFQTALAIAWTLFALVLTVRASRTASRALWFGGAAVLALVVAKLFLVDLSRADALVRVGAFIGVGALMLWIGYASPLPPAERRNGDDADAEDDLPAESDEGFGDPELPA